MAWRIKFGADRTLPIAEFTDSPVAVEADVPSGGLIVFVAEDGRLSCLEYWTTTDDVPAGFPPPEHIAL